ncbi:MAG: hypothetical protein IPL32_20250 [Chloracidobacterium sp.]|nr:hypothetical protein [Chloracidobacterium sp.]
MNVKHQFTITIFENESTPPQLFVHPSSEVDQKWLDFVGDVLVLFEKHYPVPTPAIIDAQEQSK